MFIAEVVDGFILWDKLAEDTIGAFIDRAFLCLKGRKVNKLAAIVRFDGLKEPMEVISILLPESLHRMYDVGERFAVCL